MFVPAVVVLLLPLAVSISPPVLFGRPRGGFLQAPVGDGPQTEDKYLVYSNITQKVDHFGGSTATWKQRYQYNSKFYNASKGIVFLMIGGEGSISPPGDKWVKDESITMMQWAQKYGAAAFQLEHPLLRTKRKRSYEESEEALRPLVLSYHKQDTQALQLLTIDQALEDIKEFIQQMNEKYFSGNKHEMGDVRRILSRSAISTAFCKIIFPGDLSAFYRETYPSTTIGAVASSAPINLFVDYYGYLMNSGENYGKQSKDCATAISTAFAKMQKNFYNGTFGRDLLVKKFNSTRIT
ncbi:hypothetical protein COOONC_17474 [Cooperia oncophora]